MTTAGGLAWAEVLRAVMLRDGYAGLWSMGTLVVGAATFLMLTTLAGGTHVGEAGRCGSSSWLRAWSTSGQAWWSIRDSNHQWAREHAVSGVA